MVRGRLRGRRSDRHRIGDGQFDLPPTNGPAALSVVTAGRRRAPRISCRRSGRSCHDFGVGHRWSPTELKPVRGGLTPNGDGSASLGNSRRLGAASAKRRIRRKQPRKFGARRKSTVLLEKSPCCRPSRMWRNRRLFRAGARSRACTAGEILGAARSHEHGAALAPAKGAGRGPRTSRSGLRLVHRGLRHAGLEAGKGLSRRAERDEGACGCGPHGRSAYGRYCCKSPKSNKPKNLAKVDLRTTLSLRRFSTPLRGRVIDFG